MSLSARARLPGSHQIKLVSVQFMSVHHLLPFTCNLVFCFSLMLLSLLYIAAFTTPVGSSQVIRQDYKSSDSSRAARASRQKRLDQSPDIKTADALRSQMSVLSLNCWLIPVKFAFPYIDRNVLTRAHRVADYAVSTSADVLLLQEVWSPNNIGAYFINLLFGNTLLGRSTVEESLRSKGYTQITPSVGSSIWNPFRFFDSGLMIASKYPILLTDFLRFETDLKGEDRLASKGVLAAAIQLPDSVVIFVTTHLSSPGPRSLKEAQLDIIMKFISEFKDKVISKIGPVNGVVLGGDFNLDAFDQETYQIVMGKVRELGFKDSIDMETTNRRRIPSIETKQDVMSANSNPQSDALCELATNDSLGEKCQKLDYLFASGISFKSVRLTPGNLWRAPVDLRLAIKDALFAGDKLKVKELRNQVDEVCRKNSVTDHAGIIGVF